mmetsp:Transcript_32277/g.36605  ORF Transcript_32277/g.36605 Transcript_32277/m.36605 type:complete len:613 (+) Transcript_32277:150-1988(+)
MDLDAPSNSNEERKDHLDLSPLLEKHEHTIYTASSNDGVGHPRRSWARRFLSSTFSLPSNNNVNTWDDEKGRTEHDGTPSNVVTSEQLSYSFHGYSSGLRDPNRASLAEQVQDPKAPYNFNAFNNTLTRDGRDEAAIHYQQMLKTLLDMGFSEERAETAINLSGGSTDLEQLLIYLVKGPNGWEHGYLQGPNYDTCLICNDPLNAHVQSALQQGDNNDYNPSESSGIFLPEEIRLNYDKLAENHQRVIDQEERAKTIQDFARVDDYKAEMGDRQDTCPICYCEIDHDKLFRLQCDHRFCTTCVEEYLEDVIRNNKNLLKITCPQSNCQELCSEEVIKLFTDEEMLSRYKRFRQAALIDLNPDARWCPRPGCELYVEGANKKGYVMCECGYELCFKCGEQWHGKKSCQEVADEGYSAWAKGKNVQLCPKCHFRVEKVSGCNHMTCVRCNFNWCWICRGKIRSGHFDSMNPFGCAGLQFQDNEFPVPRRKIYWMRTKILLKWFVMILAGILAAPFVIVFGPSGYLTVELEKKIDSSSCFTKCLVLPLTAVLLFAFTPLIYAISLVIGIFGGLYLLIETIIRKCKNRRHRKKWKAMDHYSFIRPDSDISYGVIEE